MVYFKVNWFKRVSSILQGRGSNLSPGGGGGGPIIACSL